MGLIIQLSDFRDREPKKHPKCHLTYDSITGDYDCGYKTNLLCDKCKYGTGRRDPEAECNKEK